MMIKLKYELSPSNQKTGWICPRCGKVYAPYIMECIKCNNKVIMEQNTSK